MSKLGDLIVSILKTRLDQILAKLISQGVVAAPFSSRSPKNFENEKIFLCLKNTEIDIGGQFWVKKNDPRHKNSCFLKLNPPFFRVKFCDVISPDLEELPASNFA